MANDPQNKGTVEDQHFCVVVLYINIFIKI